MRLWTGAGGAAAGGEADNIYRVNIIKQHLYQETGGKKNTQAESKLLMT